MESDRLLHNDGEDEVIVINQELIKLNLMMIGESQLEMFSKHEAKMLVFFLFLKSLIESVQEYNIQTAQIKRLA